MAITITYDVKKPVKILASGHAFISGTIKDSAYATGGTDLSSLAAKFKKVYRIIVDNPGGFLAQYDATNKKLKIFRAVDAVAGTRVEVANTTDISSNVFNFIAVGKI